MIGINFERAVEYTISEITYICRNIKKRPPGSEGEREAAHYMAHKLKNDCGCNVFTEDFSEHPSSFYGYFYISTFFAILTWGGYFIHPAISIVFGLITLALFILQFCLYKQIIDPLFPSKESINVTAVRPCTGELKQRIFLNGHIDAAWEFPLNYYFGGVVFEIPGVMTVLGILACIIIATISLFGYTWSSIVYPYLAFFIPFFLLISITYNPLRVVDGANDNLSGCYIGISLLRELELNGISFEHTEIGVILTGSEEAGLRGAKAWCAKHRNDYNDVPTYIISYDTIHDPEQLAVNERDLNGTVKADAYLGEMFVKAAKEIGVPCKRDWVPPFGGSTNSAAFTQSGFSFIGVTGLNHKLENYYHTRKDSWDNMNPEGLNNCLKISFRLLQMLEDGVRNKR